MTRTQPRTRSAACPLCDGGHLEITLAPDGSLGFAPCSECACPTCGEPMAYVDGEPVCLDCTRYVPSEDHQ